MTLRDHDAILLHMHPNCNFKLHSVLALSELDVYLLKEVFCSQYLIKAGVYLK